MQKRSRGRRRGRSRRGIHYRLGVDGVREARMPLLEIAALGRRCLLLLSGGICFVSRIVRTLAAEGAHLRLTHSAEMGRDAARWSCG